LFFTRFGEKKPDAAHSPPFCRKPGAGSAINLTFARTFLTSPLKHPAPPCPYKLRGIHMNANKTAKASVFTLLFSEPERLRELYNALSGGHYDNSAVIVINTLQDALFMDRLNDLSFTINGKLVVLIEHQSSINPNMALRILSYIARIYEKLVDHTRIYSKKKLTVPHPEFIVLYNGEKPYPAESVMKLSEHFETIENHAIIDLELTVKVYNINHTCNRRLEERSPALKGYAVFVEKLREYMKTGLDKDKALKEAVNWCRRHGYIREFLKEHGSEVVNMLFGEWNLEEVLAVRYEDGWERGLEQGLLQGGQRQQLEIARKLKVMGLPLEQIAAGTGLDADAVAALAAT
jgi:predicted transposase/invertase (TIGR01784 family)